MNRLKNLNRLETETFDICIIGGGATGVGCALDAALRGLKVILIDKNDFGAATSSRSTKLFHGGVRYLEQAVKKLDLEQFRMVNKALHERRTLIKNAPHLAQPLALMTPCYSWFEGLYYNIGLKIYDYLAGDTNLAPSEWLSREAAMKRMPQLQTDRLRSAVLYYDGQFDDARYTLALAKTASEKEATLLNYVEALDFQRNTDLSRDNREGSLKSLNVRDVLKNEKMTIRAKIFINATGPFSDTIRLKANPQASKRMRVSKGVHVVLPRDMMGNDTALLIPKTADGRVIFVIPWQRRLLIGTTDEDCALTENEVILESDDVDYLLKHVNQYFTKSIRSDQVRSGFGGLRPLLQADPTAETKGLVRDHEVEICKKSGLISIMGGKWTTYRLMAKDTIDKTEEILRGSVSECKTADQLLVGAEDWHHDDYKYMARRYAVPEYVTRRLNRRYGSEAHKVLALCWKDGTLRQAILPGSPMLKCEIVHACVEEMACTLRDVCARRLGLELTDWQLTLDSLEAIALVMQEVMWFSSEEREKMVEDYRNELLGFMKAADVKVM
jgi:glycerol-3-phosphate dehydrogenase